MPPTTNAVTNALDLLDLLGNAEAGMRLKDIALQLDLPESTTHRLLASLESRAYVEQRADGTYLLGWKIVVLANALGDDARLVQLVRPWLGGLSRRLGHTVNLAVISNDKVMYLDCQTPPHAIAISVPPGWTLPIHATSLGKSMLAFTPDDERDALLDRISFEPMTAKTITGRAEFLSALDQIRTDLAALDRGEMRLDVSCAAAPLIDSHGRARAAISVTGPTANLPIDWEQTFTDALRETAAEISTALFGARPALMETVKG